MPLADARRITEYGPWLYRLFDDAGALLYIGKTVRLPVERLNGHWRKPWWAEVTQVSLERHRADWVCLAAEVAAIKAERPRYNIRSAVPV